MQLSTDRVITVWRQGALVLAGNLGFGPARASC